MRASPETSISSSIHMTGYARSTVKASSFLHFIHIRSKPSFFQENTIGHVHFDCASSITLMQSILSMFTFWNWRTFDSARYSGVSEVYDLCGHLSDVLVYLDVAQAFVSYVWKFGRCGRFWDGIRHTVHQCWHCFASLYPSHHNLRTLLLFVCPPAHLETRSYLPYCCKGVYARLILLLPLFLEMVAAYSRWTMSPGMLIWTPFHLLFDNVVGFFEPSAIIIVTGIYARALISTELSRSIPLRIKLGFCTMYMILELLFVNDIDASAFGEIWKPIATLNSSVLSSLFSSLVVLVFQCEWLCNTTSGSDAGMYFEIIVDGRDRMWMM